MSTSTETLLTQYQVDTAHAQYVADLALKLFDASHELHAVSSRARHLLETGALLHNVAMRIDPRKHHSVGRDLVLSTPLADFDDDERAVVACLVAFHRKKVRPKLEAAYLRLGKHAQELALQLAAMLRIADGLDYSQSQSTQIEGLELQGDDIQLQLSGPHAQDDGARATEKADLWHKVFGGKLVVEVTTISAQPIASSDLGLKLNGSASEPAADLAIMPASSDMPWLVQADDSLSEAARKVLRRSFQKLLSQEDDVRDSDDPEAVHQMRVATRRLRAALKVLGSSLNQKEAQHFRSQLRAVAESLGAVRDRDVFLMHAMQFAEEHESTESGTLVPLIDALRHDRDHARARLLRKLDSRRYTNFKRACSNAITASDKKSAISDEGPSLQVRYAAGSILWQGYEQLRVYETVLPVQGGITEHTDMVLLHSMRIAGKHFRYTLELFSEALGPKVDQVLEPLLKLQEHLGALQDIEVATAYVRQLSVSSDDQAALEAYVQSRHNDHNQLLSELPRAWEKVASATFRRRLMELIVKL